MILELKISFRNKSLKPCFEETLVKELSDKIKH